MAEKFYSLLTNIGKAKIANSVGLGTKMNFAVMKVGDGGGSYYEPTEDQTDLKNVVWSGNINHVEIDAENPNWINIEVMIPSTVGGFTIREYGAFDEEGNMLGICKTAESYKPVIADGSTKELLLTLVLAVSNTESVTLKIDPAIIFAKKSEVEQLRTDIATQLSELTNDRIYYCGATSGTNTYTVTNSEITAYTDGLTVRVKIGTASTSGSTLNINGLGAKAILDTLGNPIVSGGLKAGLPYQLCYNGTNFIVLGKGGGGNATADKVLSGYTFTNDSGPGTGTIPSKSTATYNPSTSAQTIAAGQYLSGIQTIAAITGTATDADVIAGKTYNSATGIMRTGTASIQSLGGKKVASGTVASDSIIHVFTYTSGATVNMYAVTVSGLSFKPSVIILKATSTNILSVVYTELAGESYSKTVKLSQYNTANNSSTQTYNIKGDVFPASVTEGGFVLPVIAPFSLVYNWIAYE